MGYDDCRRWGDDPADLRALDAWLTRTPEEAWGLDEGDVVSVYTRADALADGVLVDATDAARELGIALPVALGCEDPEQLARVLRAAVLALVVSARVRRDVDRVDLVLRGRDGWVECWAAVDGDGLTVGVEGEE